MKTLILAMSLFLISAIAYAQKNNPYNQRGVDFVKSMNLISNDFNSGNVKEFNQESLNKYSKLIPLQNQVSLELSSTIVKTLKAPGYSFNRFVSSSSMSDYSKSCFPLFINFKKLSMEEFRQSITDLVNEINQAKIARNEKELLLSIAAMSFHSEAGSFAGRGITCETDGPFGPVTLPQSDCILAAACIGGYIGFQICGIWCGLGGAIVGGLVAALC